MAISRFENYDPALYQPQPMEYVSKIPGELLLKAGAIKEDKFNKGVELADAATGLLDKLTPAPGHEKYKTDVANKYNQKIDEIIQSAKGNYGDTEFQRKVIRLASEVANDPDVFKIKTSKDYYDKFMAPYISDPKTTYDIKGIKHFDSKTGQFEQNTDLYASMNNIPYADVEKRLNDAMAQVKPGGVMNLGNDPRIKTLKTPAGESYMYDLTDTYTSGVYMDVLDNVLEKEAAALSLDMHNPYTRYYTARKAEEGVPLQSAADIATGIYTDYQGLKDKFVFQNIEKKRQTGMLPVAKDPDAGKKKTEEPAPPVPVSDVTGQTTVNAKKYNLDLFTPGGGPTFKVSKKGEGMTGIPLEFEGDINKPVSKTTFNITALPEKEKKLAEGVMRTKFPNMYNLYKENKLSGEDQLKVANYIKANANKLLSASEISNNQAVGLTETDQDYNTIQSGKATKGTYTINDLANNTFFAQSRYYDNETGTEILGKDLFTKLTKDEGVDPKTEFVLSQKLGAYNGLSVVTNNENYTGGNMLSLNGKLYVQESPRAYVDPLTGSSDNPKMQALTQAKDLSRIYNAGGELGLKEEKVTIDLSFAKNVDILTKTEDLPDGSRVKYYSDKNGKSWTTDPNQLYQAFKQIAINAQQSTEGK